ncbi:hypothetical protein [Macrococcus bovicus]|uniref:DUF4276 family protein n=1 Tax=Macrococcus bovicus TaxID=69968 RepID=A0A4R6C240_9STAP|nr:hypothetical protein [Macrococcus bovicus]TDM14879.1 hypothetical protein ERX55_02760 [Macrococcus bovicus]
MNYKIVALVEGDTDEAIIKTICKKYNDEFEVFIVRGDLFTENTYSNDSIKSLIGNKVKNEVMKKYKLKKEDIVAVIQISDIDGVFIGNSKVEVSDEVERILYTSDGIKVCSEKKKKEIENRNKAKCINLCTMISSKILEDLEYKLFYFSCNLEHVLFDNMNMEQDEKDERVYDYIEDYNEEELLEVLEEIASTKNNGNFDEDYKESWVKIQSDTKIHKDTNVNLIIEYIEKLAIENKRAEKGRKNVKKGNTQK